MDKELTRIPTRIGRILHRHHREMFGIWDEDRLSHMYIIGRTGTGKSTLLENLIYQDLIRGKGLTLLDPHGDLVERVRSWVPTDREKDLVYLNVPDPECDLTYNPLRHVQPEYRPLAASGMLEVFRKLWGERAWGQRLEQILRNALLALLEVPDVQLSNILRLVADATYRKEIAKKVSHEPVRDFWLKEFPKYTYRYRAEAIAPIQSKVGALLSDPRLYRILARGPKDIRFRKIMDEKKILLVNLSIGRIGSDSAHLLGGLIVTTLGLAGFTRADIPEDQRTDHILFLDEFQSFTTLSLVNMLSELRKYHIGMCMSHQYMHQIDKDIREAVLGNVGTLISFRVGTSDATVLAKELEPTFEGVDLLNLPNYQIYLKLMIDGRPSKPFSAMTLPPPGQTLSLF